MPLEQLSGGIDGGRKDLAMLIFGSAKKTLPYRSFLARMACHNYKQIKSGGETEGFLPDLDITEERNILRILSGQIMTETANILESLGAISLNPGSPPEERALHYVNYRTGEVHEFYESFDESTNLDFFKSIFKYPAISDLDTEKEEERRFIEDVMETNAKVYKEFFLAAKDAWDLVKPSRDKMTHGFLLQFFQRTKPKGGKRTYPEGCDDYLNTLEWNDDQDNLDLRVRLIGPRANVSYLNLARNAVNIQNDIFLQLERMIRNRGEPVMPNYVVGQDELPEEKMEAIPDFPELMTVETNVDVSVEETALVPQMEFFESVDELKELYSA